jgi:hypothetical protein
VFEINVRFSVFYTVACLKSFFRSNCLFRVRYIGRWNGIIGADKISERPLIFLLAFRDRNRKWRNTALPEIGRLMNRGGCGLRSIRLIVRSLEENIHQHGRRYLAFHKVNEDGIYRIYPVTWTFLFCWLAWREWQTALLIGCLRRRVNAIGPLFLKWIQLVRRIYT